MGAYLSAPRTEKDSMDAATDSLVCGASSMQGWRINQEDAHNCELNFDEDASFFAVYDGHGGPEIALYCSKHLPAFLKASEAYVRGDFEQALKDSFLGFDSQLLLGDVIEELKVLAGDKYSYGDEDGQESDSEDDLAELKQEGAMPIEAVLSKYRSMMKNSPLDRLKDGEPGGSGAAGGSGFKPHSPCLRGKKQAIITANGSEKKDKSAVGEVAEDGQEEEAVSSSSCGKDSKGTVAASEDASSSVTASSAVDAEPVVEEGVGESKPEVTSKPMESPDSSSSDAKIGNSDAAGSSSSPSAKPAATNSANDVSSSCSTNAGGSALSSSADVEPGPGAAASIAAGSSVNGESSSTTTTAGSISSTNIEREAKRVARAISQLDEESESDDDEEEKDMTYSENNSTSTDLDDSDEEKGDEDEDDDEEEDIEEEEYEDDAFISNMVEEPGKDSGCTAVVALRKGRTLYVANAGDSRCVLSRAGKAIEMSFDHKPEDQEEFTRINNAGGRVTMDGRVNGGLNLSRAIGDHAYKMNPTKAPELQMISAMPDIKKIELTDDDDFMVLACDGIWNYMSSEAVIQFVKARLDKGETHLSRICEELFDHCLAKDTSGDGTGCDNMTAIVVRFKWPAKPCTESEAAPAEVVAEVGLKRAASSSPLPEPEISGTEEADGGIRAKRAKTELEATSST